MGTDEWTLTAVDVPHSAIAPIVGALTFVGFAVDEVTDLDHVEEPARTIILVGDGDRIWNRLRTAQTNQAAGAVALLDNLDPSRWSKALGLGATPVKSGCSSRELVDAVSARARGDVVLPIEFVAQFTCPADPGLPTGLDNDLLRLLAKRVTVRDIAVEVGWSERTIRRRLQSLYVRLGVDSYNEAIEVARRLNAT